MFKKFIIIIILLGILLVGFELVLDLVNYETDVLFQYQPSFGWSHMSNKTFWYMGNSFSINNDGFRDAYRLRGKTKGLIRVAFVSSHYLRGTNSSYQNLATTILDESWNKNEKRKIEIFNFAMPKYNLKMTHFLIKEMTERYEIDYFIYLFDPQKDPMTVAGNSDIVRYGPALVFGESGEILEQYEFERAPFASDWYKGYQTYQLVNNIYDRLRKGDEEEDEDERDSFEPYPEIYFDNMKSELGFGTLDETGKIMDYIVENNESKVYFLILPPQHTQFFNYYEENGNPDTFNTREFMSYMKEFHGWEFNDFLDDVLYFMEQVRGNNFDVSNLGLRLKERMENKTRVIDLSNEFLGFIDEESSDGFLFNWHRRDAGQRFLAEILEAKVIPMLLSDD